MAVSKFVKDIPLNSNHPSFEVLKGIESKLPNILCPKLILWGKKDFCFNDHFLNKWKEIYPQSKVIEYAESGHYVLEDAKEKIIRDIGQFL